MCMTLVKKKYLKKAISYIILLSIFFNHKTPLASENFLLLQTTTSLRDSGFLEYIIPKFNEFNHTQIRYVAAGTGKALTNAKNCDTDLLIVHSKPDEIEFINNNYGKTRKTLMYNNFVLVAPKSNPANIFLNDDIIVAFTKIANTKSKFLTRSDSSGTYKAETKIWEMTGINPILSSGDWYLESGLGMGFTLNIAINLDAYVLSDNATWLQFNNKYNHHVIPIKDTHLLNIYSIVTINHQKCPNTKKDLANIFSNWLLSEDGQDAINVFTVQEQQLFYTFE